MTPSSGAWHSEAPTARAAVAAVAALGLLWGWWALDRGAYFPQTFYPGAIALAVLIGVLLLWAPLPARLVGAPRIALVSLSGLAVLGLLSAFWTPSPGVAISDFHQVATYTGAFLLGAWICLTAGRRMRISLLPLVLAGGLAAAVTLAALALGGDPGNYLHRDLTLKLPLGYRNANAAFFMIAFWASAALLATQPWKARLSNAGLAGSASACLGLALLSQSRGALLASAVAGFVYLAVAPRRARALGALLVGAAPTLLASPWIFAVFSGGGSRADAAPSLRAAAIAIVLTALLAAALAFLAARWAARISEPRWLARANGAMRASPRRRAAAVALGLALCLAGLIGATGGDPVGFARERAAQVRSNANPDFRGKPTRFSLDLSTRRYDAWRVALVETGEHPLLGGGAGSFEFTFLANRRSHETLRDPHSIEMLLLAELGLAGFGLLVALVIATTRGVLRTRRLGPAAAGLSLGALTIGSYWLAHASVDWFWNYPGLTAPVLALLGAACAPAMRRSGASRPSLRRRTLPGLALLLVTVSMLPAYASALWTNHAYTVWRTDPAAAYASLDRAHAANPLSPDPLLAEGAIATRTGDLARAAEAFRRASELQPHDWAPRYLLGRILLKRDPSAAVRPLRVAVSLNPGSGRARTALARALRGATGALAG